MMGAVVHKNTRPGHSHKTVTASDSTVLEDVMAVVCLTAGNCVIEDSNGISVTYAMTAGQKLDFQARKIKAASTGTYAIWR
jgi:hypothetical protein